MYTERTSISSIHYLQSSSWVTATPLIHHSLTPMKIKFRENKQTKAKIKCAQRVGPCAFKQNWHVILKAFHIFPNLRVPLLFPPCLKCAQQAYMWQLKLTLSWWQEERKKQTIVSGPGKRSSRCIVWLSHNRLTAQQALSSVLCRIKFKDKHSQWINPDLSLKARLERCSMVYV